MGFWREKCAKASSSGRSGASAVYRVLCDVPAAACRSSCGSGSCSELPPVWSDAAFCAASALMRRLLSPSVWLQLASLSTEEGVSGVRKTFCATRFCSLRRSVRSRGRLTLTVRALEGCIVGCQVMADAKSRAG